MPDAEGELEGILARVKRTREERDRAYQRMRDAEDEHDAALRDAHDAEEELRKRIEALLA